jgi:hypothetical protein
VQIALGAIVGTAKFDVRSGVVSCGSLEALSAPGSSATFDVFQGAPVIQVDCDHFQSPTFVFIDAVSGQGAVLWWRRRPRFCRQYVSCCHRRYSALCTVL